MSQTAVIGRAAESFVIEGGRPLQGRIRASGNKNGALPILAACLLTAEPVQLHNVPRIVDVETMIELLNDIGAEADWTGPNDVQVHAADVVKHELDEELCSRMRASFLLAGPLLARVGSVSAPPPGGDVIGRRRLDPHIHAFAELGAQIDIGSHVPKIEDGPWPAFPSDLTSVALTVATQAQGTILMFEKMFENRLFFTDKLVSMGARIILCDPHRAVVTGPAKLRGQRMESPDIRAGMAMLLASLCAEGSSTIGAVYQIDKGYERIDERLRALGAHIDRIDG